MLIQTRLAAGLAVLCLAAAGCRSAIDCAEGCARPYGSPLAGMRYDCSCEGGCGSCANESPGCGESCGPSASAGGCSGRCADGRPTLVDRLTGCTGCGDLYWCDWYNHPPALCQPCDCHGNFTGPGVDRYILPNASGRSGNPAGAAAAWPEPR